MKNITIKVKLIFIFIVIKIIPLLIIAFITYKGASKLENYLRENTKILFNKNKEIILNTANASIEDSIKNLDKKSQIALERLSFEIANNIANFLYERDKDILFLSNINLNESIIKEFYKSKMKNIITHEKYIYNDKKNIWESTNPITTNLRKNTNTNLKDNEKEFSFIDPLNITKKSIPIYKEISFFDLQGKEKFKVSQIDEKLLDLSNQKNTYINSETYFHKIKKLKKGEIYVSDVIGEYIGSKIIGTFTKEKAKKLKIDFKPEEYAYAGKENPVGKEFQGIIRFITPVFNNNNNKIGFISLALDHKHIMQFTDTSDPVGKNAIQNISDASNGNYAFMWNYQGKNISHPRDYFIVGYDKKTGKQVMPWLSSDIAEKFNNSNKDINTFLKSYPTFEKQTLNKKPNISQLVKDGHIALDCRYLNFAPQCDGWMQVTQNGGYGSFVIYWSNVWKLTTAATIPYYTGKYANSKRGFGFVTIGANIDEFHAASNKTKQNVTEILNKQTEQMKELINENRLEIKQFIASLINELSVATTLMIILIIGIAIWMSNYITSKIKNLLMGTKKFANNELDYRIKVTSKDEIGDLEESFNTMALKIKSLLKKQKDLNEHLEEKVNEKTKALIEINQDLENKIDKRTESLKNALLSAQQASRVKSTFLANISHEIRTPLNSIIGFSQVLSKCTDLTSKNNKYTTIIESSARSLLDIINDILDISKIESGNFEITKNKTNIKEIAEHIFEFFINKANEKNIKLKLNIDKNIPVSILTDGIKIRQVLSNFISNAIKFTPEFGNIEFSISEILRHKDQVKLRFLVKDSGIGIPENKIKTIFQAFVQVNSESNKQYEGTGLGLSICTHIVDALNSEIKVETKEGEGTSFWFDLEANISNNNIINKQKITAKSIADNLGLQEAIGEKLLTKFKNDIVQDLDELKSYIDLQDSTNIVQKAHYIKNSCLNIGLKLAVEILQDLESNSSADFKYLTTNFNNLKSIINSSVI